MKGKAEFPITEDHHTSRHETYPYPTDTYPGLAFRMFTASTFGKASEVLL